MTDIEQDFLIERAKSRQLEDKLMARDCTIRKLTTERESLTTYKKTVELEFSNILALCQDFQELGPWEPDEALRRVLAIMQIAEGAAGGQEK